MRLEELKRGPALLVERGNFAIEDEVLGRLLSNRPLQSHADSLSNPSGEIKKPVPRFLGVPVASLATISTTARLAFAMISGVE